MVQICSLVRCKLLWTPSSPLIATIFAKSRISAYFHCLACYNTCDLKRGSSLALLGETHSRRLSGCKPVVMASYSQLDCISLCHSWLVTRSPQCLIVRRCAALFLTNPLPFRPFHVPCQYPGFRSFANYGSSSGFVIFSSLMLSTVYRCLLLTVFTLRFLLFVFCISRIGSASTPVTIARNVYNLSSI